MSDELPPVRKDQSLSDKELSRRKFLAGAAQQIAVHSLVTVPTIALVLNGAAIPANAKSVYERANKHDTKNDNKKHDKGHK
jgi:hypothetical protein